MKTTASRASAHFVRQKFLRAAPLLAGIGAAPAASGAIIFTSVNGGAGLTIGAGQHIYFDPVTGQAATSTFTGQRFDLYFYKGAAANPDFVSNTLLGSGMMSYLNSGTSYEYAFNLTPGASISSGSPFLNYGFMHYGASAGQWAAGQRGFAGLKLAGNHGWADVEYTVGQQITLYGFAYEDTGGAIAAGAVPEPAATGLAAALLAGSAAAWTTRKKRCGQKAA